MGSSRGISRMRWGRFGREVELKRRTTERFADAPRLRKGSLRSVRYFMLSILTLKSMVCIHRTPCVYYRCELELMIIDIPVCCMQIIGLLQKRFRMLITT